MPEHSEGARAISCPCPVKNRLKAAASHSVIAIDNDRRMLRYIRTILENGQGEVIASESKFDPDKSRATA